MDKDFKIGDIVYFSPKLKTGTIILEIPLWQLRPAKGTITGINQMKGILGSVVTRYTIDGYEDIHTVASSEEQWFEMIVDDILRYTDKGLLAHQYIRLKNAILQLFH